MFEHRVIVSGRFGKRHSSSSENLKNVTAGKEADTSPARQAEKNLVYGQALSEESFTYLYDSYFSRLYNYVAGRTASREEAEDIVAFVFEQLLNKFHTFDPKRGSLDGWVFTIAQNAIIDRLRYKRRHSEQALDERLEVEDDFSLSEQLLKQEEIEQLRRYLARLSERERELLRLRYGADLSHRRIGELMQMKEGNVAVSMRRILHKLHSFFEAEEAQNRTRSSWTQDR